jgi:hypothetical protein
MAQGAGGSGVQHEAPGTQTPVSTVLPPRGGLASNSNYALYDQCNFLVGLSATIDVSDDIVLQSATGSTMGFNFQLNAYAHQANSAWQQYVVGLIDSELHGKVNNWKYVGTGERPLQKLCDYSFNLASLRKEYVIPAGHQFIVSLLSDAISNINGMTVRIIDGKGAAVAGFTQLLLDIPGMTQCDLAPITAFHLVLVGPAGGNHAVFASGAGSFTYSAPSGLTVLSELPNCVVPRNGTAESSNSLYGPLAAGPSPSITQSFGVAQRVR